MVEIKRCKYLLPCGYCDKYDMPCKASREDLTNYYNENIKECEHEWVFSGEFFDIDTKYVIRKYTCKNCGENLELKT